MTCHFNNWIVHSVKHRIYELDDIKTGDLDEYAYINHICT